MKSTMSSVNIYFTCYRNNKFYYKSLKHTSFSTWFEEYKEDVDFDVKNRNSSIVFLYIKSKCANFACVLLDQ